MTEAGQTHESFVNKMKIRTAEGKQTIFHRGAFAYRKRNGT